MAKPIPKAAVEMDAAPRKIQFNFNKLQATICILLSASVSIAVIAWALDTIL